MEGTSTGTARSVIHEKSKTTPDFSNNQDATVAKSVDTPIPSTSSTDSTQPQSSATDTPKLKNPCKAVPFTPLPLVGTPPVALASSTPCPVAPPNDDNGSRKRQSKPKTWKKTKKSSEYNSGLKKSNGTYHKREVGPRCDPCKRWDCRNISDEFRQEIMDSFWSEESDSKFRQSFIIGHTERVGKKTATVGGRQRGDCINYTLTVGTEKKAVCQKFFLNTLGISTSMVLYNLKHTTNGIRAPKPPKSAHNKTPETVHQSVVDHINKFPRVESHYCRQTTKRMYLESSLNIRELWRLYKKESQDNRASENIYRKIFLSEFNLGFHKPKKDQCDDCDTMKKLGGVATEEQMAEHDDHLRRKRQAREALARDKEPVDGKLAVTFDLQQVLTVPRLFAGSSYYKRKLNTYNLTFYELQTSEGHCYYWTEAEACRGANDIATAVVMFLEKLDSKKKYSEIVLYSDTCGGQNRNRIICTAILSFLSKATSIKKVTQKFFESGHSHMECDSMHSAIEKSVENQEIELPSDYVRAMKVARKDGKPYAVTEICHDQFKAYDRLNSNAMPKTAFTGIIKVHQIVYNTNVDGNITLEMGEEIGEALKPVAYRKRGAPVDMRRVETAYDSPPGIPQKKKTDLLSMLSHFSNQSIARLYYNSLPLREDEDDN